MIKFNLANIWIFIDYQTAKLVERFSKNGSIFPCNVDTRASSRKRGSVRREILDGQEILLGLLEIVVLMNETLGI